MSHRFNLEVLFIIYMAFSSYMDHNGSCLTFKAGPVDIDNISLTNRRPW